VSEEFTVCVFRRHFEVEAICFFRTISIPDYFVSVWMETIAVPFG
jgi:isoprenylcysteine carboxyl methyltransferase (ICMT) family protein YpbQ